MQQAGERWLGEFLGTCLGCILLTISLFGKSKGEKAVAIIVLMHSWKCFISTEGLEYGAGSSWGLRGQSGAQDKGGHTLPQVNAKGKQELGGGMGPAEGMRENPAAHGARWRHRLGTRNSRRALPAGGAHGITERFVLEGTLEIQHPAMGRNTFQ